MLLSTAISYGQLMLEMKIDPIAKAQEVWLQLQDKQGQAVYKQCTTQVQQKLTVQQLNGLVQMLELQMGTYQSNEDWKTTAKDNFQIVTARMHFKHADIQFTISYNTENKIGGIFFSPIPKKAKAPQSTSDFTEKKISIGSAPYILNGLLTLPKTNKANYPCVVLVHGSGQQDMNESIGPNKPFQDIAHGLAKQGIASIRYNKRTFQYAQQLAGIAQQLSIREVTIDDAVAAVQLAQSSPSINPKQVFVLGHSMGGMCLPRILHEVDKTCTSHTAGGILVAANASPLEDIILWQMNRSNLSAQQLSEIKKSVNNVKKIHTKEFDKTISLPLKLSQAFWKSLIGHNQVQEAAACPHPMLFLFGGRDIQVPISEMGIWKKGLKDKIDQKEATFISYPTLSHLMMPADEVPSFKDYQKKGHVKQKVIDDIAKWIKG